EEQAVHVEIVYPDAPNELNRWLPLVKWFLAIPHFIVLFFLDIAAVVVVVIAWFAILFTGRYPEGMFDFVVGVMRWSLRVTAYTIPAKFVIDSAAGPGHPGISLGIVVLVLGLLVVVVAFSPWWKVAGLVLGVAVIVTGFLYVYQVRSVVHDAKLGKSVRDFISLGPYLGVLRARPPGSGC